MKDYLFFDSFAKFWNVLFHDLFYDSEMLFFFDSFCDIENKFVWLIFVYYENITGFDLFIIVIDMSSKDMRELKKVSKEIHTYLKKRVIDKKFGLLLYSPVPSPIEKIKKSTPIDLS